MEDTTSSDYNVSIRALRPRTRARISTILNPIMVIPTVIGTFRYWRGLAGLCGITSNYEASIAEDPDPTSKVLHLWYERDPQHSSIRQFLLFLEEMDRFDVIADIMELIDEDVAVYKLNPSEIKPPNLDLDKHIITTDDVMRINEGQTLEIYDAFVLYDEDDLEFAIQLLKTMEERYNMRFCVKNRDFVGGGCELDKMVKVITERCKRLIVILSDSFFASSANHYYLSFAHAYGLEKQRKIIPCMYKDCTLPPDMKFLFVLDYRRMAVFNFWDKLRDTLRVASNDKFRSNGLMSNNSQTIRSVFHESYPTGLKANPAVRFSSSEVDLSNLHDIHKQPLNPSTSADQLAPFPTSIKKEKRTIWKRFHLIGPFKKQQTKVKNDNIKTEKSKQGGLNKFIKRKAVPVAN